MSIECFRLGGRTRLIEIKYFEGKRWSLESEQRARQVRQ